MKSVYSSVFGILACVAFGTGCSSSVERDASPQLSKKMSAVSAGATDATFATSGKAQDLLSDKSGLGQIFSVSAKEAGAYHVRVWAMGANGDGPMSVYLDNGASPIGTIQTSDEGWRFYPLKSLAKTDTLKLSAGSHTFSVRLKGDHAPQVEFFQIAKAQFVAAEADNTYANFISTLSKNVLPADYAAKKLADAMYPFQTASGALTYTSPPYDYCYELSKTFTYTYWNPYIYLSAGYQYRFETRKSDPCASDPVLYLFSTYDRPMKTWSDDDSGDCSQSYIVASITTSGYYTILARSYFPQSPGTSDLYKDGQLFASNIALAGAYGTCGNKTGTLSFFTAKITQDTLLFLTRTSKTGPITDMNDDYYGSGDFSWGVASRINRTSSDTLGAAILSAYSSYWVPGRADLYLENKEFSLNCNNVLFLKFPNLKCDDAIISAPSTDVYNCISYAGGITDALIFPAREEDGGVWYDRRGGPNAAINSFDAFFGNHLPDDQNTPYERYPGAWTYTRNGATESTSVVDLWALNGVYTHASVRKPGNCHPHGYDWESKPGGLTRIFHPRHALRGLGYLGYGDVDKYYIPLDVPPTCGSQSTLRDSINRGQAVLEDPVLTESEDTKLTTLAARVPLDVAERLSKLLEALQGVWVRPEFAMQADAGKQKETTEHKDLVTYCQAQGKIIWPLLFRIYVNGQNLIRNALFEITEEKRPIFRNIRDDAGKRQFTADGKFIVSTPHSIMMKYVKALLSEM